MLGARELLHFTLFLMKKLNKTGSAVFQYCRSGLEKSTRPLVFTSASGCRASENLDNFQCKLTFFPYMPIIFVMQG